MGNFEFYNCGGSEQFLFTLNWLQANWISNMYLVYRCAPYSTIPNLATELQCCLKIDWLQLPQYQTDSAFGANNIEMLAQCSWDVKYLQTLICNNKSSQWCRNQMIFIFSQHYKVIFRYRKSSVRHVGPRNNKLLDCIGN